MKEMNILLQEKSVDFHFKFMCVMVCVCVCVSLISHKYVYINSISSTICQQLVKKRREV